MASTSPFARATTRGSAFWSSSASPPTAKRSGSPSSTASRVHRVLAGLLLDLKARGLAIDPRLAIGDGALGFWAALGQVYPDTRTSAAGSTRRPTCSPSYPSGLQGKAKADLHEIWMAAAAQEEGGLRSLPETYEAKYPKAPRSWPRIATSCWRSTTSRPNTGCTCGRPTRSSRPSLPCVTAPHAPRTAAHAPPSSAWPSSWPKKRPSPGDGFAPPRRSPSYSAVHVTKTEFRCLTTHRRSNGRPPERHLTQVIHQN